MRCVCVSQKLKKKNKPIRWIVTWKFEFVDLRPVSIPGRRDLQGGSRDGRERWIKSFLYRLMICTSGIISDYVVSAVRFKLDMRIQLIRANLETRQSRCDITMRQIA